MGKYKQKSNPKLHCSLQNNKQSFTFTKKSGKISICKHKKKQFSRSAKEFYRHTSDKSAIDVVFAVFR